MSDFNENQKLADIRVRDPFIFPDRDKKLYYLYSTGVLNIWKNKGCGFYCYTSSDLKNWTGPMPVFSPEESFWADTQFWAPEVHFYNGKYYLFATFNSSTGIHCRGTQILVSQCPSGPFKPLSEYPVTPHDDLCLDGTLYTDENNDPWIVYCHEWCQTTDGEICAMHLSKDLKEPAGKPVKLFCGSDAPWSRAINSDGAYVTDGPFLYKTESGRLLMLWSGFSDKGYTVGIAASDSGKITGPWVQLENPLYQKNGGHCMIFKDFDDTMYLAFHQPNDSPDERTVIERIEEKDDILVIVP